MAKRWGRVWAVGFVLWTLLAFLSAAGAHVYTASTDKPISWAQLLAWSLTVSTVWSLFTPPVYELGRRFTFDRNNWKRSLPIHLVAGIAVTFLSAAIVVWIDPVVTWTNAEPQVPMRAHMLSRVLMDLQRYWYIVLITQAIAYYGKYRERELLSSQLEAQLANAQLDVLKSQLEPHFLFNTLNSIAALARNDGPAAENMTLQLADLLRASLDAAGVHEVPLEQELSFLQKYIDIQQMRFQDRLIVETDVDPVVLSALVPNLLLQPLVENAIRHGIAPRRDPGLIRLSVWRDPDDLWIEVRDNGVGLSRSRGSPRIEGVGLRNTRARLTQLYNDDHMLVLDDAPGGGCCTRIRLPYREHPRQEATANADSSFVER
jgi:two-component system LytT family sensor kinase